MFSIFGSSGRADSPKVQSQKPGVGGSGSASSSSENEIGKTDDGISVEQVESLDNLHDVPDHFQITGTDDSESKKILLNQIHRDHDQSPPSSLTKGYRAMMRNRNQKDSYRHGIDKIRVLLLEKYDQNAVDRFDKHFSYRMWAGKPLTVRALKEFIYYEDKLREGSINIDNIKLRDQSLEHLRDVLSADSNKKEYRILGGGKVPDAAQSREYCFPILPIARSWFATAANDEDLKKGRKVGASESIKVILTLVDNETTKNHVEHLFNAHFSEKIKKGEPLQVMELSSFIEAAIKIRNNESGMLGGLFSAVTTAKNNGEDLTNTIYNFLKGAYHDLGLAAGAAIVLDEERSTNDPIMGLVKGIAAGTLVTT
jgi:hypothetical protein